MSTFCSLSPFFFLLLSSPYSKLFFLTLLARAEQRGESVSVLCNDRPYRKEISWPTLTMISIDHPQELAVRVGGLGTGDSER